MRGRALCLVLAFFANAVAADESPVGISFVETNDLRLYYYNYLRFLGPHAVRTFTNSHAWQKRMLGWRASERTTVLLQDFADYGNATAFATPFATLIFDVAPLSHAFETFPAAERMYSLMNHELIHVVQGDIASEEDRTWRAFFQGKVPADRRNPESLLYSYLTVPRYTVPRWYSEGSAVFMETWMGGGLGRAQGGYDEMVFRAMVRDGAHFYDPLGLASRSAKVEFQGLANAYLYGTRFFTWLAYAHSPEKVLAWLRRDEDSKRYYADQFVHVFGIPLEQAWQDWVGFEREFQRRNLVEVRKHPITPHRALSGHGVGSISRMYYDEATGILYGGFRIPGIIDHIGALNTRDGTVRRLADIKGAMHYKVTSFAFDPKNHLAFFTNDNFDLRDLLSVDVATGETRMLIENARVGEMVVDPIDQALIGVRHEDGLATLVRIPRPHDRWSKVVSFPYGVVPYDLDISPDGRLLSASVADVNGDQFLRVWEMDRILKGDLRPLSEFRFGQSVPESFVFSRDGRYLFGSSYYTGVSNIFRYEVATGSVEAVSNAETGFFRPIPLADGKMVVLNYTAAGFSPAIIDPTPLKDVSAIKFLGNELVTKYPVIKTWQVPPPSTVDEAKLINKEGVYHPIRSLKIANGLPVLQGYKNSVGVGYRYAMEDPLGFSELSITAAYTPDDVLKHDERLHADINFRYRFWRAALSWNRSDFYDLFGPTIRSRKGFAAKLGHDTNLIWDLPRRLQLKVDAAFYDRIDTLPEAQNVAAVGPRLVTTEIGLHYTDARRSLGAVDDEKGLNGRLVFTTSHADGKTVPALRGDLDFGIDLPLAHSSVWLRNSAGTAQGDRRNPYTNFYFGGFGNNYVDNGPEKRYREHSAFPGFDINELEGRSYTRHMLEWNLPPYTFESVGMPAFHLTWLRPAIFGSLLWTEPRNENLRRRFANLGAQVDLGFNVLHRYFMTVSLGYAVGYRGTDRAGNEWMISLKIM